MNAKEFKRLQEIFLKSLEHPPGGPREKFLRSACRDIPYLENEVRSLWKAQQAGSGVLDRRPLFADPTPRSRWLGQKVGSYRLMEEIGQGGMGIVFLAERDDDEFHQRVALKLIDRRIVKEDLLRRFLAERQILAGLQHPYIARLLDGGTTPEGQPYFVMEFIDGMPITEHCDRNRLTIGERLGLFLKASRAVHYAHQNLVIHRDLKPSNILVTVTGEVKLLDFGIAKALDDEGTATLTRSGVHLLTPECASPEQIEGRTVTTASDVYALGVLLYRLLCGRLPHPRGFTSYTEHLRVVAERDPLPPSAALERDGESPSAAEIAQARCLTPARLKRRLSGDLDMITLKCLQQEPDRRYASAQALETDVDRHRKGLPVRARPNAVGYRLAKFVRRHQLAVGAGLAVLLALIAGIAGTVWQGQQAALERDRARREADKARRVVGLMQEIFRRANPKDVKAAEDLSAGEILERGARSIREELLEEPEIRASIMGEIGWSLVQLGRVDSGEELLGEALSIQREILGETHPDVATTPHRQALLEDHLGSALAGLGKLYQSQGRYRESEPLLRRALGIRRAALPPADPHLLELTCTLADSLVGQGKAQEAARLLLETHGQIDASEQGETHRQLCQRLQEIQASGRSPVKIPQGCGG